MGALGPTAATFGRGSVWPAFVSCMATTAVLTFATGSFAACAAGILFSVAVAYLTSDLGRRIRRRPGTGRR